MVRRLLLPLALLSACSNAKNQPPPFTVDCTAEAPAAEALLPAAKNTDGSSILPDGRKITPAGKLIASGGFPVGLRLLPGDRYVVVSDAAYGDEHLRIVDTEGPGNPIVSNVDYPRTSSDALAPALFYGLQLNKAGTKLYVSDGGHDPVSPSEKDPTKHYNVIEVYSITGTPPQLAAIDAEQIHLPFTKSGDARYPAGLALSADEQTLYAATQLDGSLAVVDLRPGAGYGVEIGRTPQLGVAPYDVVVDDAQKLAYVSLWGGSPMGADQFADGVQTVDLSNPTAPMPKGAFLTTAKASEGLALLGGKLYVTAADGDQVSAFDLASGKGAQVSTAFDATGLYGSTPNGVAVDATRGRLYVANAGENAVQAFDLATLASLGRIPTAWYPTAVAVAGDGTLVIASAKGLGAGPLSDSPDKNDYQQGVVEVVPMPSLAELMAGDAQVHANVLRPHDYEVKVDCTGATRHFPLPVQRGDDTPIKHVFLIVRENKTYDAVLGDLPGANGMPSLALFGGDVTPNLHALAQRFVNLDNFYSLAEQSLQGHEWTTTAMANDYTEKAWLTTWGRATRPLTAFSLGAELEHLALPASRTIWAALDAAKVPYHNYGEVVNTTGAIHLYDPAYPGVFFDLDVPDVDKINYVLSNVQDPTFTLEPFNYILIPRDHTYGTSPGKPTPQSMVADNDEATGRFIDALSKSPYWMQSIVFIIEDDPSDGGDHVELHRSPCLVISPWVRSGYTSSVHYDVPAVYKTMTLLLGIPPINLRDANAAAMYDVFAKTPDSRPYDFIPRKVPDALNTKDSPLADESAQIDWSKPDQAPLGRILWKAVHGKDAEPPWGKPVGFVPDHDD